MRASGRDILRRNRSRQFLNHHPLAPSALADVPPPRVTTSLGYNDYAPRARSDSNGEINEADLCNPNVFLPTTVRVGWAFAQFRACPATRRRTILMTSKNSTSVVMAMAAILSISSASYAASQKNRIPVSGETGYTNPAACLGGGCTTENPDRVRQPCSGSQCYKRTRTNKSSEVIFEVIRAG